MKKIGNMLPRNYLFACAVVLGVLICIMLVALMSGYYHSYESTGMMMLICFVVQYAIYFFGDPILFILLSIDRATWPKKDVAIGVPENVKVHTQMDYLKLRLRTQKFELSVPDEHRNEYVNLKYRLIAVDLYQYAKYFFLLMFLVILTRDQLLYSDFNLKRTVFTKNGTDSMGLSAIRHMNHVYYFIQNQLIDAFGVDDDLSTDWKHGRQNCKIGVVALRQLRRKQDPYIGWNPAEFSQLDYSTNWKLPFRREPYTNKYWKIYTPWLQTKFDVPYMIDAFYPTRYGYFQSYPVLDGYTVLLSGSKNNSIQILNYLKANNWLDHNTAVLFMEFVMFNMDANILTACTLQVEQTPQGLLIGFADTDSIVLVIQNLLGTRGVIFCCVYLIVLLDFSSPVVTILWYEPGKMSKIWNMIDFVIIIFNIVWLLLVIWCELLIRTLTKHAESVYTTEFIDFNGTIILRDWSRIVLGFIVCLATLRLWKVLQFARVFQLMSSALYTALPKVLSTSLLCIIFLMAFSMSIAIINGNNSKNMIGIFPSIITSLCNCFGFHAHIKPKDFSYGGSALCLICYMMMAFIMATMLVNLLKSTLSSEFIQTKQDYESKAYNSITFFEFLKVEYANFFQFYRRFAFFSKSYRRHNRTVSENIKRKLNDLDRQYDQRNRFPFIDPNQMSSFAHEIENHNRYKRHIERIFAVSNILSTQMEMLDHMLFNDIRDSDSYDDESY